MLDDKLYKIIEKNKPIPQAKKFMEEAWEMCESLISYEHEEDIKDHLIEEIGDCYTVLREIQLWYGISDELIKEVMEYKSNRTLERMKSSI